jgi:hypothetical protein
VTLTAFRGDDVALVDVMCKSGATHLPQRQPQQLRAKTLVSLLPL